MGDIDRRMAEMRDRIRVACAAGDDVEVDRLTDELIALDSEPRSHEAPPAIKPGSGWGKVALALLPAVFASAAVIFILESCRGGGRPAAELVSAEAITECQKSLRQKISYPATARFPWSGVESRVDRDGSSIVWVDFTAKNAFGVDINMRGMCIFQPGSAQNPEVTLSQQ